MFSVVNGGQDLAVTGGTTSSAGSDCGSIEFTKEDVEALLNEKIKTKNKFNLKVTSNFILFNSLVELIGLLI